MRRWSFATVALLLVASVVLAYSHQASSQGAGWITLFDGKSLDGWDQIGDANWRVTDGALVADKGNGFLVSKTAYGDFQIRAEFWVEDDSNSGIFIRCTDAIVNIAKVNPMPKAAGKWNVYEITAKGDTLTVTLNGQKTVDGIKDAKHASGRIALQHGLGLKDDKGVANDKG